MLILVRLIFRAFLRRPSILQSHDMHFSGKRHILAFLMAPSMLAQATGEVRVSTSPRLTEGIGEGGLVLVRAVVAERDVVIEPVPVKPPGMFRLFIL